VLQIYYIKAQNTCTNILFLSDIQEKFSDLINNYI